jgi:hypothetical protein
MGSGTHTMKRSRVGFGPGRSSEDGWRGVRGDRHQPGRDEVGRVVTLVTGRG